MSLVTIVRHGASASIVTVVGVPGPAGPAGPPGDGSGGAITPASISALAVAMRLSEFDTEPARAAARANLGLQDIDGGTF